MSKPQTLVNLVEGGLAAEMVLARPPRLVRASLYLMVLCLLAAVAWSHFSRIDTYILANGVVRPQGDLIKVQSQIGGKLAFVGIREGDLVTAGQVLFRVDPIEQQTELDSTRRQIASQRAARRALAAACDSLAKQHTDERRSDQLAIQGAELQLQRLQHENHQAAARVAEAQAKLAADRAQLVRTRELHDLQIASGTQIAAAQLAVDVATAAVSGAEAAASAATGSVRIAEQDLAIQRNRLDINDSARNRVREEITGRLIETDERIGVLESNEKQLGTVLEKFEIRAPAAGIVTNVLSKNAGEVVSTGTHLASFVPGGADLIVEAYVTNRDAGPLRDRLGAQVKLKFDAFPFRDFGTLTGTLSTVGHDAEPNDQLGLVYRVEIAFRPEPLVLGSHTGKVRLGMTVTAEILKEQESILMLLFRDIRDRVAID